MKEKVGFPWTTLPDNMFQHAAGGYGGQGTLCGSLGACSALLNLITADARMSHNYYIADLINWYASYNHPTDQFDAVVKFPKQIRVVPNSPLCHISVSTWTMEAGTKISSKERKDRCAKVAGRVAMQTVLMLNARADGKFKPFASGVSADAGACLSCHGPAADHNQQGRMECGLCHPHSKDHAE